MLSRRSFITSCAAAAIAPALPAAAMQMFVGVDLSSKGDVSAMVTVCNGQIKEICEIFSVPVEKVRHLVGATYSQTPNFLSFAKCERLARSMNA